MMGLMETRYHLSGEKFEFNILGTDLGLRSYVEAEAGCLIEDHQREFLGRLGQPKTEDRLLSGQRIHREGREKGHSGLTETQGETISRRGFYSIKYYREIKGDANRPHEVTSHLGEQFSWPGDVCQIAVDLQMNGS